MYSYIRTTLFIISMISLLVACGGGSSSNTDSNNMLTVDSHTNNVVVEENPITISGTVDVQDATVTVSGVQADIKDGQFSASVTLAEGVNTLNVVAQNDTEQSTVTLNVALNTTQICGTGETFTVNLPGLSLPDDPSTKDLTNRQLPNDTVTFPKGCSIYTILVHGYARNTNLDALMFYNLAKFVAENNGYVHWSWWNNFLGEYMARSLHASNEKPSPGSLLDDGVAFAIKNGEGKAIPHDDYQFQADAKLVLEAIKDENPDAIIIVAGHSMGGNAVARLGRDTNVNINLLAPIDPVGNRNIPKGVGTVIEYDKPLLSAIILPPFLKPRSATPGALFYTRGNETFNWTRWRATRNFRGYRQRDCVRGGGLFGNLCKDFDSRPFKVQYRCTTYPRSGWLEKPPLILSRAPIICPRFAHQGPILGSTLTSFRSNIKRLYHRWQQEAKFPYDFHADDPDHKILGISSPIKANYTFGHPARRSNSILSANYQAPVTENSDGERNIDKTCSSRNDLDPRDAVSFDEETMICRNWDGHGEIIGMRATSPIESPFNLHLHPLALSAQPLIWPNTHWLEVNESAERRERLIAMRSPGGWPYQPKNPDLDLVVDDLVLIAQDILENGDPPGPDRTAPTSTASFSIEPNAFGWNNSNVVVTLSAIDNEGGSGVKLIRYFKTGANGIEVGVTHQGNDAVIPLTDEGTTKIRYFAVDNEGNRERPFNTQVVKIDKTLPIINVTVVPQQPNEHGWYNTDVTVSFTAEDALSGIDTVSDPIVVTTEGVDQEIIGVATDRAGNTSATGAILNIDKTPPKIIGMAEDCKLWPPNHQMVDISDLLANDELSGIDTVTVDGVSSEPHSGIGYGNKTPDIIISNGITQLRSERYSLQGRTYDLNVSAVDLASNVANGAGSCIVEHDQSK